MFTLRSSLDPTSAMRTIQIGSFAECKQAALELYAARYGTNPPAMKLDEGKSLTLEHPNMDIGENYFAVVDKWDNQTEEWKDIYKEMREHDKRSR